GSFPIWGNSGQLGQLFLNLMSNGLEAAGPRGRVQVHLTQVGTQGKIAGRVEIIDSGFGPPASIADRLFEPFVTSKPEGVGLGLALARQVAEAHGGRIGWTRTGQSTVFFVELPLQNAPQEMTMGKGDIQLLAEESHAKPLSN